MRFLAGPKAARGSLLKDENFEPSTVNCTRDGYCSRQPLLQVLLHVLAAFLSAFLGFKPKGFTCLQLAIYRKGNVDLESDFHMLSSCELLEWTLARDQHPIPGVPNFRSHSLPMRVPPTTWWLARKVQSHGLNSI